MDPKYLKAFIVGEIKVAAFNGSDAKVLAAPLIRSNEEWCNDVSAWVALRAERDLNGDDAIDQSKTEAYIISQ